MPAIQLVTEIPGPRSRAVLARRELDLGERNLVRGIAIQAQPDARRSRAVDREIDSVGARRGAERQVLARADVQLHGRIRVAVAQSLRIKPSS